MRELRESQKTFFVSESRGVTLFEIEKKEIIHDFFGFDQSLQCADRFYLEYIVIYNETKFTREKESQRMRKVVFLCLCKSDENIWINGTTYL